MNIIIVGCGKIGNSIASALSKENHSVTLIDQNESVLEKCAKKLDVLGVTGNGTLQEVLLEAGVENCDCLIATTRTDEVNMLCCLIAKKNNDKIKTIARIRNSEYDKQIEYLKSELGILLVVNPEKACAREIVRMLRFPVATRIDTFVNNTIDMIQVKISEDSSLVGAKITDLQKITGVSPLIAVVVREDSAVIPNRDYVFRKDDLVSYFARPNDAVTFAKYATKQSNESAGIFIIGAGTITQYILSFIQGNKKFKNIKVVDSDLNVCRDLASKYEDVTVINGNGGDKNLLLEEGIQNADYIVSLTGIDEQNIIISLLTARLAKNSHHIMKINSISRKDIPEEVISGNIVSPKNSTCDAVLRVIRGMEASKNDSMETLYRFDSGAIEAMEFKIVNELPINNIPLKDLPIKKNLVIAAIVRNHQMIRPGANDVLKVNDHIVIVTESANQIRALEDIIERE